MTDWVALAGGGRRRGPAGIARAWLGVIVAPRTFFRSAVVPGAQAPGLIFAMAVVGVEEAIRLALLPEAIPRLAGGALFSAMLVVGLAAVLVTPAVLHLIGALQTVLLRPLVADRASVNETVQVIAYAAAPCAMAGPPIPALRIVCATYGTGLLIVGLATVHDTSYARATVASAVPAAAIFGYGFRGFAALGDQLAAWPLI